MVDGRVNWIEDNGEFTKKHICARHRQREGFDTRGEVGKKKIK